jgi:radical SAM protein with 4Fe4S-binding SPASM domain
MSHQLPAAPPAAAHGARPPQHGAGIRDGNGILFISHTGAICPSGFLEIPTGNVRHDDLVNVYRSAPLFRQLRMPTAFDGRCGRCEFQLVCGGSRARAYSATGDPLSEDPLCAHEPRLRPFAEELARAV